MPNYSPPAGDAVVIELYDAAAVLPAPHGDNVIIELTPAAVDGDMTQFFAFMFCAAV